jgi:hypothetical protein
LQMCKFGSLNFFHNTFSNIHKQQGMFFFFFFPEFLWTIIYLFLCNFKSLNCFSPFFVEFVFELFFPLLHFVVSFIKFYYWNFNWLWYLF